MNKLVVFASGGGSNFRAILQSISEQRLSSRVVALVVNRQDCGAADIADNAGIPVLYFPNRFFGDDIPAAEELVTDLLQYDTDYLLLAGFLRKIPRQVLDAFPDQILNIHPALLPAFGGPGMYGMRVHAAVCKAGVTVSGATVHFVNAEYDRGAILLQRAVELTPGGETPATVKEKVLRVEHQLYPAAVQLLEQNRVVITEGRVTLWER